MVEVGHVDVLLHVLLSIKKYSRTSGENKVGHEVGHEVGHDSGKVGHESRTCLISDVLLWVARVAREVCFVFGINIVSEGLARAIENNGNMVCVCIVD